MKAIQYKKYGSPEVLQIIDLEKPVPADKNILIKIKATSVNYGDLIARRFKFISPKEFNMPSLFWLIARVSFGWNNPKPKTLGSEFSGEVESVGKDTALFKKGDQVFGYLGQNMGAYAEYLSMPETGCVTTKPANLTFEEAAVIPMGAVMAVNLLRKADIRPGQKVLINGASGSIGSAALQIAKHHYGAEVTAVCGTRRHDYVKSLGADEVIDYSRQDFTQNGEKYDLIFDVLGKSSFAKSKNSLTSTGKILYASFKMKKLLQMISTSFGSGKKVICAIAPGSREDLMSVKEMIEAGKIKTIIDRSFPFDQTAEAHKYIEEGEKKGSVVITVE